MFCGINTMLYPHIFKTVLYQYKSEKVNALFYTALRALEHTSFHVVFKKFKVNVEVLFLLT